MSASKKSLDVDMSAGKRWYFILALATIALLMVGPLLTLLFPFIEGKHMGWIYVTMLVIAASRLRGVKETEFGGITALNMPALEVGSGFYFIPFGARLDTMPVADQQYEFPDEPERVSKRPDAEGLRPGEVRPMRILSGPTEAEYGDDPINTRLALEQASITIFRLEDKGFFELWTRIPGNTWEEKLVEIRKRLRDTNETELLEEFANRAPPSILKNVKLVNGRLKRELQKAVRRFGVKIVEAKIKSPDFPKSVNEGLASIGEAKARRQKIGIDAQAERGRLITVSEGKRQAGINEADIRQAQLAKEGEGVRDGATAAGMSGRDFLAADVARQAIGEGDIILGPEGVSQLVGLGKLISQDSDSRRFQKRKSRQQQSEVSGDV